MKKLFDKESSFILISTISYWTEVHKSKIIIISINYFEKILLFFYLKYLPYDKLVALFIILVKENCINHISPPRKKSKKKMLELLNRLSHISQL